MVRLRSLVLAAIVVFASFILLASARADDMEGMDMGADNSNSGAMGGMGAHMKMTPHMTMTELRPATPADTARGQEIIRTMRDKLAKYEDYKVAIAAGYVPYMPTIPQDV